MKSYIWCLLVLLIKQLHSSYLKNSVTILNQVTEKFFKDCNLFLVDISLSMSPNEWTHSLNDYASSKEISSYTGGYYNIKLQRNQSDFYKIQRPQRMISSSCSASVMFLPVNVDLEIDRLLTERLENPVLNPVTVKNADKYVIVTKKQYVKSLYHSSQFISSLKYVLAFADSGKSDNNVETYTFCRHCMGGPIISVLLNFKENIFPDYYENYHGSVLKLSASDKLPGLLEMSKHGEKYIAVRGVYASALFHLVEKLNFTYDLKPSSGGGSTGHPLANGTWVGTVGDAYSGRTDFGLVCGMTFIRFPVIELCATITFEYISFAVGPPAKVYTWKAIFWPFAVDLWMGMVVSLFLASIAAFIILKKDPRIPKSLRGSKDSVRITKMSTSAVINYFLRTFIEQGLELPIGLSESLRVLLGYWLFFVLVSSTAYRSKMVSFMTFPVVEKLPNTFDELAKSKYDIAFHYFGNVAYNTFKTSTNPTYVNIFGRMAKEPNPLECLKDTLKPRRACILFGIVYDELRYRNLSNKFGESNIRLSPNYGFMYTPGVLHKKKAALSSNFKRVINTAMEMGIIGQWQKTDMNGILKNKNQWERANNVKNIASPTNEGSDVLHLKNLIGAFTILTSGLTVSFIAFLVEYFKRKLMERPRFKKSVKSIISVVTAKRHVNTFADVTVSQY